MRTTATAPRIRVLTDVWRTDPQRSPTLHVIALCDHLLPGFHRMPQAEPGMTLEDLLERTARRRARPADGRASTYSACTTSSTPAPTSHATRRAWRRAMRACSRTVSRRPRSPR
ncbi:hypothetical protein [Massilia phosphatilytica]